MSRDSAEAERAYRAVDALYRLHNDLFAIEAVLVKTAHLQVRLTRQSVNGQMGALVAGLLILVPILISLGDIKWGSTPAVVIYVVTAGVIALWIFQVRSAQQTDKELLALENAAAAGAMEDRNDFMLEEVNASVVRHRLIADLLDSLRRESATASEAEKASVQQRIARWEEVLSGELDYVHRLARKSLTLVHAEKRSAEEHETLLDWAKGIPNFQLVPVGSAQGSNTP
jgi:hypothetical protein